MTPPSSWVLLCPHSSVQCITKFHKLYLQRMFQIHYFFSCLSATNFDKALYIYVVDCSRLSDSELCPLPSILSLSQFFFTQKLGCFPKMHISSYAWINFWHINKKCEISINKLSMNKVKHRYAQFPKTAHNKYELAILL